MRFRTLASSQLKDKYFYRTEKWDWLTEDMIYVLDSKSGRLITMDNRPQAIYLAALGQLTVGQYICDCAQKWHRNQIPEHFDALLLDAFEGLVWDAKIMALSEQPHFLPGELLHSVSSKEIGDIKGIWKCTISHRSSAETKDTHPKETVFTLRIEEMVGKHFRGSVEEYVQGEEALRMGEIEGTVSSSGLSFWLRMCTYINTHSHTNKKSIAHLPHSERFFDGTFSKSKQTLTGRWRLKSKRLIWKGWKPCFVAPNEGEFIMRRV